MLRQHEKLRQYREDNKRTRRSLCWTTCVARGDFKFRWNIMSMLLLFEAKVLFPHFHSTVWDDIELGLVRRLVNIFVRLFLERKLEGEEKGEDELDFNFMWFILSHFSSFSSSATASRKIKWWNAKSGRADEEQWRGEKATTSGNLMINLFPPWCSLTKVWFIAREAKILRY